jgi:uncharacterized protein
MPGGWSKPRDLAKLADSRAEFEYDIPVNELPGLPVELHAADRSLHVKLRFEREQGLAVAQVAISGAVTLECQRCLRPMDYAVDAAARVALVSSEPDADRVPDELETYLAADGQLTCGALAAEELLLALPIAPRHADAAQCVAGAGASASNVLADAAGAAAGDQETQRPFADLRALLAGRKD